jgi:protein subunit release factor A
MNETAFDGLRPNGEACNSCAITYARLSSEQSRIVAEIELRLSTIDELESLVAANLNRVERLRQAILKRAFESKLVPQDPNDEPAGALLERIRAEQERLPVRNRPKTRSRANRVVY